MPTERQWDEEAEAAKGQVFSVSHMPENWPTDALPYRKKVETFMLKIDGPFTVDTSEGPLTCADGWLALDARGYPYPIATDEQALIYEPVQDGEQGPAPE